MASCQRVMRRCLNDELIKQFGYKALHPINRLKYLQSLNDWNDKNDINILEIWFSEWTRGVESEYIHKMIIACIVLAICDHHLSAKRYKIIKSVINWADLSEKEKIGLENALFSVAEALGKKKEIDASILRMLRNGI